MAVRKKKLVLHVCEMCTESKANEVTSLRPLLGDSFLVAPISAYILYAVNHHTCMLQELCNINI